MSAPFQVLLAIFALTFVCVAVVFGRLLFQPWIQCFLAAAPIGLPNILGMRLRRLPVTLICDQRIKAAQAGIDLTWDKLAITHQRGVDIAKAVDAWCLARHNGTEVTWDDLVETYLLNPRD